MKQSTPNTSDTSIKSGETYGVANWRMAAGSVSQTEPKRDPEIQQFFDLVWPAGHVVASPLNPVFLLDLPKLASERASERWLVRDGLLPLIWFFSQNPEPGNFKQKLLVPIQFQEYVPNAWRQQVELFELFNETANQPQEIRELLLMGVLMPSMCSIARLERDLKMIVERIGGPQALSKLRIRAYFPFKYEPPAEFNGTAFYLRYSQLLFKYLGADVEFLEYESLQWINLESSTSVHEFNEEWLISNSYLKLLSLSKGHHFLTGLAPTRSSGGYDEIFPMFPNVSCGIRKRFDLEFIDYTGSAMVLETQERARAVHAAANSYANKLYPWPKWFTSWCRDFVLTSEIGGRNGF